MSSIVLQHHICRWIKYTNLKLLLHQYAYAVFSILRSRHKAAFSIVQQGASCQDASRKVRLRSITLQPPTPPSACIDRSNVGRQTGREGSLLFITGAPTPPLSFLAPTNREPFISGRDMRVAGYEICPRRPLRGHHPIKPQAVHRPPHEYGQVTNIYEDNQERNIAATNTTFEDKGSYVNLRTQYTRPAVDKKTGMPVSS